MDCATQSSITGGELALGGYKQFGKNLFFLIVNTLAWRFPRMLSFKSGYLYDSTGGWQDRNPERGRLSLIIVAMEIVTKEEERLIDYIDRILEKISIVDLCTLIARECGKKVLIIKNLHEEDVEVATIECNSSFSDRDKFLKLLVHTSKGTTPSMQKFSQKYNIEKFPPNRYIYGMMLKFAQGLEKRFISSPREKIYFSRDKSKNFSWKVSKNRTSVYLQAKLVYRFEDLPK